MIHPICFSSTKVPRFSGKDEAPPPPPPTEGLGLPETRGKEPRTPRTRGQRVLTGLGVLLASLSFAVGGIKAVDAMNDDGHIFNMPSTAERDHIRSKTDEPLLALGFFGGIIMTVIGAAGGQPKKEEKDLDKKPD